MKMRRAYAIITTTALEILSEPLVFLVQASALALAVLAPWMHYHEFGEPSRMARDAGVSALMLGGLTVAAFGALKSMRRELETQTAMSVLALPVSRRQFFLSKAAGVAVAYLFFVTTVSLVSLTVVRGSVIGGEIAAREGGLTRIYGPYFVLALAAVVVPFVYGALADRLFRKRFVLHANLCALALAVIGFVIGFDFGCVSGVLPLYLLSAMPATVLLCASVAFAARFRFNAAASLAVAVFVLFLPALGSYCLTDVLSAGEPIGCAYLLSAIAAVLPVWGALLFAGVELFEHAE